MIRAADPRTKPIVGMVLGATVMAFAAIPSPAAEVRPVIDATVMGGQYYYNGAENNLNSIATLNASPYIQFNDAWSLVPLYSGNYHGTQQVRDLVGGGTLFQDSQDHIGSVKAVRSFNNGLKLKAIGSYGAEFLRETVDESWGNGLYDNRRASGGAEAEWSWDKDRYARVAYDYYAIRFPNYTSLESQGTVLGLGRELNAPDVLDTHNHAVTLGTQMGLPGNGFLQASAGYTWSFFGSQHVVDLSGELIPDLRDDDHSLLTAQATWPVAMRPGWRLFSSLGYTWDHLLSNQNHYDAGQTFFNPNYYANLTQTLQNQWTVLLGERPWTLNVNWSLARQKYANRLIQDTTGAYGADHTHVDTASVGLGFSYPIAKGFHLNVTTTYGWSNSNNQDNVVYQYHYHTADYLMGFTYAY